MKKQKKFWIFYVLAMLVNAAAVNGAPPEVNFDTEYQVAGYTSQTTTGDTDGVIGMHRLCQQEFGEKARMCTTREWWKTHTNIGTIPGSAAAWLHSEIVSVYPASTGQVRYLDWTGFSILANSTGAPSDLLNCDQWTNASASAGVAAFISAGKTEIQFWNCVDPLKVACCTPPAPIAK